MENLARFYTDPRWGSVTWPLCTAFGIYQGSFLVAIVAAFFAGVSIERWLGKAE